MANYLIITDVAPHQADWNVLYAAYACYYKVEQSQEMRDRTWGWIIEGRIICLMALNEEGRPVGFAHMREFLRPLSSTIADVKQSNGVIHVIDKVLLPKG